MNVIACPGMIRSRRGVIPFHNALIPSSFAITTHDCDKLLYCFLRHSMLNEAEILRQVGYRNNLQ